MDRGHTWSPCDPFLLTQLRVLVVGDGESSSHTTWQQAEHKQAMLRWDVSAKSREARAVTLYEQPEFVHLEQKLLKMKK